MADWAPTAPLGVGSPDPRKHVNYELGMVLGAEDFDQEFAYLSGRDQWLARDLIGYGVAWGLKVTAETTGQGPRLVVAPGAALSQCGRLVCMRPAQCLELNAWLEANREELDRELAMPSGEEVIAYVTVCYQDCETDEVPIPGEPCRSDDDLMAPSRRTDWFRLELTRERPRQLEEDGVRDFAAWLREVPITEGAGPGVDAFTNAIRAAAAEVPSPPSSPPRVGSPPVPPFDVLMNAPPAGIAIPHDEREEYLRAAFRLWIGELRPRLRATVPGCEHGCGPSCSCEDCDHPLLLAEVRIPVVRAAQGQPIEVADPDLAPVEVDHSQRSDLLHLRMLQEWLLIGDHPPGTSPPVGPQPSPIEPSGDGEPELPGHPIVGAAEFRDGQVRWSWNELWIEPVSRELGLFRLLSRVFDDGREYFVKGTVYTDLRQQPQRLEVVRADARALEELTGEVGIHPREGIYIRIVHANGRGPADPAFAVEVSAFTPQ